MPHSSSATQITSVAVSSFRATREATLTTRVAPANYPRSGKIYSLSSVDIELLEPNVRYFFSKLLIVCIAAIMANTNAGIEAQQPRVQIPPAAAASGTGAPLVPIQPYAGAAPNFGVPPGTVLGTPTFDPYAAANAAPGLYGPPIQTPYGAAPAPAFGPQPQSPGLFGSLFGQPAPAGGVPYGTAPPQYYNPAFPSYAGNVTPNPYPGQAPSSLYPNGINLWGPGGEQAGGQAEPLRLFDHLRFRHTWLPGSDGRELDINDSEIATTIQIPNFFGTGQPFQISPNFGFHLWDGPKPPTLADMPPQAYSGYVEASLKSDPANTFGGDISASIGVFSDFNAITTESIRIQGLGYGWVRLTPTFMIKAGVDYIDRVDLALLPAIGFYWEPNPQTRLDIFFPRPKLARYLTTVGNVDFWIYLSGEYGGGSWTIDHSFGGSDQVDINDIRVIGGTEWTAQSGWKGLLEVGWVTQRQLVYRNFPGLNTSLTDTFMVRAGFVW